MITTLIFDLWDTLGKKNASLSTALQKHFNISLHGEYHKYEQALQLVEWESKEEMAKNFLREFKLEQTKGNVSFIVAAQEDVLHLAMPFERIRQLITRYKEHYRIVLLSNTTCFEGTIIEKWGFEELFDKQFVSYETGLLKPSKESFIHLCEKIDVYPRECVFIDDSQENCEAAQKLGMHTIRFENVAQLQEVLADVIAQDAHPK